MSAGSKDELSNNVLSLENAQVFHFLVERICGGLESTSIACGNVSNISKASNESIISIDEANKDNLRPCKDCVRDLKKFHGIDVEICTICDRTTLMDEVICSSEDIEYAMTGPKHVFICTDCKDNICSD